MENLLILLIVLCSKLSPAPEQATVSAVSAPAEPDPLEIVWSSLYPSLVPSEESPGGGTRSVLPSESSLSLGPAALYATNRTVWRNYLAGAAAAAAEEAAYEELEFDDAAEEQELLELVRARLSARLGLGARAVLHPDSPPDVLSPAARELATACMDLSDLAVAVPPADSRTVSSPLLRSFLELYAENADQPQWQAFAAEARSARFRDAVHLVARVPRRFLGQAYTLVEQLGPPADFREGEQLATAREFLELRLRLSTE